jgi:hypothetical protein
MTADVIMMKPSRKIMIESAKNIDKHINKELIVEVMLINKGLRKIMKTIIIFKNSRILYTFLVFLYAVSFTT